MGDILPMKSLDTDTLGVPSRDPADAILPLVEWAKYASRVGLFLHTSTTGDGPTDEVIEIAVVDMDEAVPLVSTPVRPTPSKLARGWHAGSLSHGLTPAQVVDAPTWPQVWQHLRSKIRKEALIGIHDAWRQCRIIDHTAKAWGVEPPCLYNQSVCFLEGMAIYYSLPNSVISTGGWKAFGFQDPSGLAAEDKRALSRAWQTAEFLDWVCNNLHPQDCSS